MTDSLSQHCPNCEAQAAEIEKLREALKHQGEPNAGWDDYRSVVYDAHAALEETK